MHTNRPTMVIWIRNKAPCIQCFIFNFQPTIFSKRLCPKASPSCFVVLLFLYILFHVLENYQDLITDALFMIPGLSLSNAIFKNNWQCKQKNNANHCKMISNPRSHFICKSHPLLKYFLLHLIYYGFFISERNHPYILLFLKTAVSKRGGYF